MSYLNLIIMENIICHTCPNENVDDIVDLKLRMGYCGLPWNPSFLRHRFWKDHCSRTLQTKS
jgi:hypothetical protein